MYIIFILFLFLFLATLFLHFRKKQISATLKALSVDDKLSRLNEITKPLGVQYDISRNIFSPTLDAWQKSFGYCRLYDEMAARLCMVCDCEPIYFNYDGHTWLVEFWKGQYGIKTGGEIGVYKADRILPQKDYGTAMFHAISAEEMPLFSFTLYKGMLPLYQIRGLRHWWAAGFCMGQYTVPELLRMEITITFNNCSILLAFVSGLEQAGYNASQYDCGTLTVSFTFYAPKSEQPRISRPVPAALAMWKNRTALSAYRFLTKPYANTLDRLLCLYEFSPAAFGRMFRLRPVKSNTP